MKGEDPYRRARRLANSSEVNGCLQSVPSTIPRNPPSWCAQSEGREDVKLISIRVVDFLLTFLSRELGDH
jgi:hypothetical protein